MSQDKAERRWTISRQSFSPQCSVLTKTPGEIAITGPDTGRVEVMPVSEHLQEVERLGWTIIRACDERNAARAVIDNTIKELEEAAETAQSCVGGDFAAGMREAANRLRSNRDKGGEQDG